MSAEHERCPACGGRLLQEDAPACPYCAHVLGGNGKPESPNAARLSKMRDHELFPGADAATPAGEQLVEAIRSVRVGAVLTVVGLFLALATWRDWNFLVVGLGAVAVVLGLRRLVRGWNERSELLAHPLVRRPALVMDRRSETTFNGWSGRVTYYFTMEFDDGLRGEFRFPGRGWPHEPLARGATGVAYTRGPELLEFRNIKV